MRGVALRLLAVAFVLAGWVVMAVPSFAAELSGPCSLTAASFDAEGTWLGSVQLGPDSSSNDGPLPVDPQGMVQWSGEGLSAGSGSFTVTAGGVELASGQFTSSGGASSGVFYFEDAPAAASSLLSGAAVVPVAASVSVDGVSCSASGQVQGTGSPVSSPVFLAGAAVASVGVLVGGALLFLAA